MTDTIEEILIENQTNNYILKRTLLELIDSIQKNNITEDIELRIKVNKISIIINLDS